MVGLKNKIMNKLYITDSNIEKAGIGLFTFNEIKKGEIIDIFKGYYVDDDFTDMFKNSKYLIEINEIVTLDCELVFSYAKFANDALNHEIYKNNSYIEQDENNIVYLIAKQDIFPKEEIFCSYGNNYWDNIDTLKS
jgi:hypothetical protein